MKCSINCGWRIGIFKVYETENSFEFNLRCRVERRDNVNSQKRKFPDHESLISDWTDGRMTFAFPSEVRDPVSLHRPSRTVDGHWLNWRVGKISASRLPSSKLRGTERWPYRKRVSPRLSARRSPNGGRSSWKMIIESYGREEHKIYQMNKCIY